jgi:hypothetical protein
MRVETYLLLKYLITDAGFGDDITWAENIGECQSADDFALEHCFVVCNSGMRAKTACGIFNKVKDALTQSRPLSEVFGHKHKCYSIQHVYDNRHELYRRYMEIEGDEAKLAFLRTLPHIGDITKFHLFKNFGGIVAKPDRHLERIAAHYETTTADLCAALAAQSGDKVPTVDSVIWRAASLEIIKFRDDVPLIPSWPYDRDSVEVTCPCCAASVAVDIKAARKEGVPWWVEYCSKCKGQFLIETNCFGVEVTQAGISPAPRESGNRQLDLIEDAA